MARPIWPMLLDDILGALPAADAARLGAADRELCEGAVAAAPRVLARRGLERDRATWQKAHAVERALFHDAPADPSGWSPGPNETAPGNAIEGEEGQMWLWLSKGTDWQAFQGGFRKISDEGLRPKWVSFKVQIATPELSAANLALSSMDPFHWGLRSHVVFGYRGDDASEKHRRSFRLEVFGASGGSSAAAYTLRAPGVLEAEHAYEVAMRFDWDAGVVSAYVDGHVLVEAAPFDRSLRLRFVALYNWRSSARAAFSDLMFSDACAYKLPVVGAMPRQRRQAPAGAAANATAVLAQCARRAHPGSAAELRARPRRHTVTAAGVAAAVLVAVLAVALPLLRLAPA